MAQPVLNSKYNIMDKALQQLLRENIALHEDDCVKVNKNLHQVLSELINIMKNNDPLFQLLFKQMLYVGSYYEKLRVKEPNEFDINLELLIPALESNIEIDTLERPGFAFIHVKSFNLELLRNTLGDINPVIQMSRWLDENGYLLRDSVLQWLQSAMDKAIDMLKIPRCKVIRTCSGPAVTLNVTFTAKKRSSPSRRTKTSGTRYPLKTLNKHLYRPIYVNKSGSYSVDLVPVFAFGLSKWPKSSVHQSHNFKDKTWFLVPKAAYGKEDPRLWRASFSKQEKEIMHNKNNMKPIIKLIKLLRDVQGWTNLSSYYIKTVFLWEQHKQTLPDFWKNSLSQIFMHMLRTLRNYLMDKKGIPFFWNDQYELTQQMTAAEKLNIANRLGHIIDRIDLNYSKHPDYVMKFFMRKERIIHSKL